MKSMKIRHLRIHVLYTTAILWWSITFAEFFIIIFTMINPSLGEYHAVAGGKMSLPCNTSLWGEDEVSLVLWYHGDTGIPIYRVDARNYPLSKSKHSQAEDLKKRIHFDVSTTPPMLKIYPVIPSDAGEYRCRVDYRKIRTQNVVITLNVTVPPKEVIIMDMEGQSLDGLIGPYDESSNVLLICEAEGGKPTPEVTWWSGMRLIDTSYTTGPHGLVRNELQLNNINRTDLSRVLTCRARNTNLTEPVENSVTLDMNLKPLNVLIVTPHRPLVAGIPTELQCRSSGSRPAAQITWWKGSNDRLPNVRDSIINDGNTTFSTVIFTPSINDNGKHISCRADNSIMSHGSLEDGRILSVNFPPQLNLALGTNIHRDSIREGNDVFLDCHIRANPWIKEMSWIFQGKPLFNDPLLGIIVSNQSLVIQKVKRHHRGEYQCAAVNDEGDTVSDIVYLKINFAPICKSGQKTLYGVSRNEMVDVTCDIEAEPMDDIRFKWSINSSSNETPDIRSFTLNATRSVATFSPLTKNGYGIMLCSAENSIGRMKEPCVFTVAPAGPPESVRNCAVTNHSMTTLLIECQPGDDGGLRQVFIIEVYSSDMERLQANSTGPLPQFLVKDLSPGTQYTLMIYSANGKGRSKSVSLSAVTLSAPERHTGKGSTIDQFILTPMIGILMTVVASIVIVVLMIVIVIKIKGNHRRNENKINDSDDKCSGEGHNHLKLTKVHSTHGIDQTPLSEEHDATDCVMKEFVDVETSINETNNGFTGEFGMGCNGTQFNCLNKNRINSKPITMGNCNTIGRNFYCSNQNIYIPSNGKSPQREITYAELNISPSAVRHHYGINTHTNGNHFSTELRSSSMRRCTIDPHVHHIQYAPIDFSDTLTLPIVLPNDGSSGSGGGNGSSSCSSCRGSMIHRESPIADGCSESEATVETPLMNSSCEQSQYRPPQEIRRPKESVSICRKSGATPV